MGSAIIGDTWLTWRVRGRFLGRARAVLNGSRRPCYTRPVVSLGVANLAFGYSNERLFQGVSFRLEAGQRAGLVAPNGAGKSTLLRVIAGELEPDEGSVTLKKGATLGYYRQGHETRVEGSVMDNLLAGFGDLLKIRHELTAAQEAAATGDEAALDRLS